jgi:hypothetical protein
MLASGTEMAESGEAEEAAEETAKKPRRKKKRKKAKAAATAAPRDALDAQGRERPRFLLDFPHDPELDALITAFENGDYARVRSEAPALAERTADPAVRDAALELRRRIDPDPLMKYLLLIAVLLLTFLSTWAYAHPH